MKSIARHISFDLWNTLIKPNPKFSALRTQAISQLSGLSEKRSKEIYTEIKSQIDDMAEKRGRAFSTNICYDHLSFKLNIEAPKVVKSMDLKESFYELFIENPPIFDEDLGEVLLDLRNRAGATISIGSNTNFISGALLKANLISQWEIPFSFMIFSDLTNDSIAKPNLSFFNEIYTNARLKNSSIYRESQILHIGDNIICDGEANKFGFQSLVIKEPSDLLDIFDGV